MTDITRTRRLLVAAGTLTAGLITSIAPIQISSAQGVPEAPPNPPTDVVAEPSLNKITVTWSAPVDGPSIIDYLAIVQPIGDTCVRPAVVGGVGQQSFECEFTGLPNGDEYRIRVRSRNAIGVGNAPIRKVILGPAPVNGLFAIPGDRSAVIRWSPPTGNGFDTVSPYTVRLSLINTSPTVFECVTDGLECVFDGLVNDQEYRAQITRTALGVTNGVSVDVTPRVDAPSVVPLPNPPADVVAEAGDRAITVTWTAPATGQAVDDYLVTLEPGDHECVTAGFRCEFTDLVNGTKYRVRVATRNAGGSTSMSPGLFTPRPPGYAESRSNIPTKVVVTPGDENVTVAWTAPVNDPGAEVDDYVVSAEPGGHSCTTTALTCSITGLTNGTEYTLRVRARNEAGLRSAPPETFTPQVPGAPIVAMAPKRILESRLDPKLVTADGKEQNTGALKPRTRTVVDMAGRAGVPEDARAVVVNVTVIAPVNAGFATLYPCTSQPPTASTLNYASGQIIANSTVVGLSGKGTFCIFSSSKTDVAIDVTGYIPVDSDLVAVKPARLYESRVGDNLVTVDGQQQNTGRLAAGSFVKVNIGGRGGLPGDMSAALVNVAVVGPSDAGFLTLYPCDQQRPTASTLNHAAGETIANGVTVKLDPNGDVCIFTLSAADVIVDMLGYTPATSLLTTVTPARLYETRAGNVTVDNQQQATGRRGAREVTTINIAGRAGVPDGASAAVVNVTAVGPLSPGYVTLFPCDEARPLASTLNYTVGGVIANQAFVKLDPDGDLCVFTLSGTDLIVDVTGYLPS